jgi:outer membrane protein
LSNRHPLRGALAASALASLLAPQLSFAQEPAPGTTPWTVGLGVTTSQRAYAGASNKTIPFPLVSYENDYFRIAGLGVDAKLGSVGAFTFALRTNYALGDGYKSGDSAILEGMETRKGSLWIGPGVQWKTDIARLSFDVMGDALGKSKGIKGKLGAEHGFRAGPFLFMPHVAAEFVDKNYVDYYYGVKAREATASRAAYDGKSTVNLEGGLRTVFMLDPKSSLFADVSVKALGKGITDSPLVDRKETTSVLLGYSYRF